MAYWKHHVIAHRRSAIVEKAANAPVNLRTAVVILVSALVVLGFTACDPPSQQQPSLVEGEVRFANGKVIQYKPHEKLHDDPEEALKKDEAVYIVKHATLVSEWQRVLFVSEHHLYEGIIFLLEVYDYGGKLLNPKSRYLGDLRLLKKTRRILLADWSNYYTVENSILLNSDGKLIKEIPQARWIKDFGQSEEDKLFWIRTNKWVPDVWPSLVEIYDYNGKHLKTIEAMKESTIPFLNDGKTYSIPVHAPGVPLG